MFKKLLITALVAVLVSVVACDRISKVGLDNKQVQPEITAVKAMKEAQVFAAELDKMKDDITKLNGMLAEREQELLTMQASLATKEASVINMSAELAAYKKNIKIVAIILVVSLILNVLLIWLLLKYYKKPAQLALPAADENKTEAQEPATPAPAETNETNQPEEHAATHDDTVQAETEKPKRGRKPKATE